MAEQKSRKDIEMGLAMKAWKDASFKKELMSNPKAMLEKEFGAKLSGDLEVEVLEESPKKLYIIIPNKPAAADELSDDALDAVAGGNCAAQGQIHGGTMADAPTHYDPDAGNW